MAFATQSVYSPVWSDRLVSQGYCYPYRSKIPRKHGGVSRWFYAVGKDDFGRSFSKCFWNECQHPQAPSLRSLFSYFRLYP